MGAPTPDGSAVPHGAPDVILPQRPPGQPIFPPNSEIVMYQVRARGEEEATGQGGTSCYVPKFKR